MKKTVRWLAGTAGFLILALVVFGAANDVLRLKFGGRSDMIHTFYEVEEDTLDVLFIGSSHAYHSVQPNLLWGEYGIPSCLVSSPGQPVSGSYYLLKEALRYQTPKVVVLETFCFREKKLFRTKGYLRQAFDSMRLGKTKIEAFQDIFPKYTWKKRLPYYIPFLMYHSRWSELESDDFSQDIWMKGGVLNFNQVPQTEPAFPEKALKIPKVTKKYLKKITELCREKGIPLVLFAAPIAGNYAAEESLRVNLSVEKYAAKRGIPFLFYQKTKDVDIDYGTDFYDDQHLNTYGTDKMTEHIGEWLVKNYGLSDHRQEEAYESWNEDYAHYTRRCRELIEAKTKE